MEYPSDLLCLQRYAAQRDAEAFAELIRRNAGMVYGVAYRITGNAHDAEDVAQNCFFELARRAGTIKGSASGWLHAVATSRALDAIRNRAVRATHERAAAAVAEDRQSEPGPWTEIMPYVDRALAELPEDQRLPLVLRYLHGLNQAEVAENLGISQSTVSRRLEAGVAALREKLRAAGAMTSSIALPALLTEHALHVAPKTLVAALGKLAVAGIAPVAATPAGGGVLSGWGATGGSGVAKGAVPLAAKVAAVVTLLAATSAGGYLALRPPSQPAAAIGVAQTPANLVGYQGWTHVNIHATYRDGGTENSESFINPAEQKIGYIGSGDIGTGDGKPIITLLDATQMTLQVYESQTKTIHILDLTPAFSRSIAQQIQRTTDPQVFTTQLGRIANDVGGTIAQTQDAALDRYEVAGTGDRATERGSLWVDPSTKMLSKAEFRTGYQDEGLVWELHYGDRPIKDIYDLGVPRDARVADERMTGEIKDFFAQLDAQGGAEGADDGVGIQANSRRRDPTPQEITLTAQQGGAFVMMAYLASGKNNWGNPAVKLPGGWPKPDLDETLRFLDQLQTHFMVVSDGQFWKWYTNTNGQAGNLRISSSAYGQEANNQHDLSSTLGGGIYAPSPVFLIGAVERKILHRADNPALIGLHITHNHDAGSAFSSLPDMTYWVDPTHNHATVETDFETRGNMGGMLTIKTQFLEYAQLPDGRTYPTHWRTTVHTRMGKDVGGQDGWFIFAPGKTLDAHWFNDPTPHFTGKSPFPIRKPSPAGVAAVAPAVVAATGSVIKSAWWWWPWAIAAGVFATAGVLLIKQRRGQAAAPALRGYQGPRRS